MGITRGFTQTTVTRLVWDGDLTIPAGRVLTTATATGAELGANLMDSLDIGSGVWAMAMSGV